MTRSPGLQVLHRRADLVDHADELVTERHARPGCRASCRGTGAGPIRRSPHASPARSRRWDARSPGCPSPRRGPGRARDTPSRAWSPPATPAQHDRPSAAISVFPGAASPLERRGTHGLGDKTWIRTSDGIPGACPNLGTRDGPLQRRAQMRCRVENARNGWPLRQLGVELAQLVGVLGHGEAWNPPHAFAQDPHDGANVVEGHVASRSAEVLHDESRSFGRCGFARRVPSSMSLGKWPQKVLDEFER